jgi:coatomer subunit beta
MSSSFVGLSPDINVRAAENAQGLHGQVIQDTLIANSELVHVVYEAATSLTALTSNPVAVKAAAGKLIELAIRELEHEFQVSRL